MPKVDLEALEQTNRTDWLADEMAILEDPKTYQVEIDSMPHPSVTRKPSGPAKVETYSVITDRKGKRFGLIVGRTANNSRFLANTPDDDVTLDRMMREEMLGREGQVSQEGPINLFRFA